MLLKRVASVFLPFYLVLSFFSIVRLVCASDVFTIQNCVLEEAMVK